MCIDYYCFLCGMTYWHNIENLDYDEFIEMNGVNEKDIPKDRYKKIQESKFIDTISILTIDDEIIHNAYNTDCNLMFLSKDTKDIYSVEPSYIESNPYEACNEIYGKFVHTDCWKYIKKEHGIEIKYSHLPMKKEYEISSDMNIYQKFPPLNISYGKIEEYWSDEADFQFHTLLLDKNDYMCFSPIQNEKNGSRINKIFSQLHIKKEKRTGPNISATMHNENTYRVGNDMKIWMKNNGKWTPIKDSIKKTFKNIKLKNMENFYKMPRIGQSSDEPIFINKLKFYDDNKCDIMEFDLITTQYYLEKYNLD